MSDSIIGDPPRVGVSQDIPEDTRRYRDSLGKLAANVALHYRFPPDSKITLLNHSENITFRIDHPNGDIGILRVHRDAYHTRQEIMSELSWLDALARDRVVQVALPRPSMDGQKVQQIHDHVHNVKRFAVMFEFVEGAEPEVSDLPQAFVQLGEVTSKLHRHAKTWQRSPHFRRPVWGLEAFYGPTAIWGAWRAAPGLYNQECDVLTQAEELISSRIKSYGNGADRFGLIHADLRLANLLIHADSTRVIDFDDCGFGWHMYDLAAALSFLEDRAELPSLVQAWTQGYESIERLTVQDRDIIPAFILLRRMALLSWVGSHPDTELARACGSEFTERSLILADRYLSKGSLW